MSTGPGPAPSNVAVDVPNLPMFDDGTIGADGLPASLSADLANMRADTSMTGMLNDGGDLIDSLGGLDMMPMNLDVSLEDPTESQNYNSLTPPSSNQRQLSNDTNESQGMNSGNGNNNNIANNGGGNNANESMTGVGAGPLPTGFGAQASISGGSTLTEFTKRRNWSQRVLEELKDFLHILTPDGRILYVSPSNKSLTGYDHDEIVGKFIVDYIHPDDSGIFVREFNESIATGNTLRFFYRFRRADGTYTIFESHGHPHLTSDAAAFGPNNAAGFCRGFFMMARPYPTKNAALLDSFLEHKIENERLTKRIADLKREEAEEAENQQRHWIKKQEGGSITPSETQPTESETPGSASMTSAPSTANDYNSMPPPAKPGMSNTALTRQNLDEANASSKPDSINDKMARYEGATHIETIEMLTGLRYRDGERSQGISTGDASPALIRGDAGIAIPLNKEGRLGAAGDKKKKLKVADEYVCTDCGTLDSPEWRKGPSGPKTLCNACGLRWAKKEKKRSNSTGGGPGPMPIPGVGNASGNSSGSGAGNPAGPPAAGTSNPFQPPSLSMQVSTGSS
ncbi:MAG: blue light receptor [Caeruleum heppii]|nr:MAG: blue light receptor [Caeruleum heppii]